MQLICIASLAEKPIPRSLEGLGVNPRKFNEGLGV